jgi:hypothetical protein
MKKFSILESKPGFQCWAYEVEAESEEQALEMIREGLVHHNEYWFDDDPFKSFEYQVESEKEI